MDKPIVAVVAFDGMSLFHLSVPCLVFGEDRTALGLPRFDFRICAAGRPRPFETIGGAKLVAPFGLEGLVGADIVLVPSWLGSDVPVPATLAKAVAAAHRSGALVIGLCLGTFVLAAAGILAGKSATTHWTATDRLAAAYPDIRVEPDILYVDAGTVITSAGVAAALDCCLHVVRRRFGAWPAQRLARHIVLPPHRQGGQAQFIERPLTVVEGDERLAKALWRVLADPAAPHSLDSVASIAGLSRRTFTRRFQKQIGISFSRWLAGHRVTLAQQLLETTTHSVEDVARLSGVGTSVSLRQHFRTSLGTTPDTYRREFAEQRLSPQISASAGPTAPGGAPSVQAPAG
jgi:transcriptional regulator GlxA family with amidase domain